MGIYISSTDLETAIEPEEFLQLFDRVNHPPTTADATILAAAIEAGEGRFHRYITRRYKLPLDKTDPILMAFIRRILVDFAWEASYVRSDMIDQELLARNADHVKDLEDIRDGHSDIPATTPPPAPSTDNKVSWSSGGREFNGLP